MYGITVVYIMCCWVYCWWLYVFLFLYVVCLCIFVYCLYLLCVLYVLYLYLLLIQLSIIIDLSLITHTNKQSFKYDYERRLCRTSKPERENNLLFVYSWKLKSESRIHMRYKNIITKYTQNTNTNNIYHL